MKTKFLLFLLLSVVIYGCSSDDVDISKQCFSISSKDIADNSLVNGGEYKIVDARGNTVQTYTLDNGTIEINNFPGGIFTIEEVKSPKGYISEEKKKKVELFGSLQPTVVFYYLNEDSRELPETQPLKFYGPVNHQSKLLGEYTARKIGEYYWVDQNFSHVVPWGGDFENSHPITQALLDRYVERIRIDPAQYQLEDIADFEKYYGRHYSYPSVLYMNQHGKMYDQYGQVAEGWKLPAQEDYRQLFAMCPFNTSYDRIHDRLNERDVRFALSAKNGENPMAFDIANPSAGQFKTYWFDGYNTNMYKFNLMPGGARLNGDGAWCNGLGPNNGCYSDGKKGDIYHLFYTAMFAVVRPDDPLRIQAIILHDYVDTAPLTSYHLLNVRWCRRLTDFELGYKLYINNEQTDIKKLGLNDPVPQGYVELPNGYTRGFYVQYILNNPTPSVTVKDIVHYARNVEDHYVYNNRQNQNIIF
ncbi:collagen binding domain-containing protein [Prevotella sp. 10(H)]|uniref:MSCRAMM family protein n=1 Tax=Prevotella sp. 10(H) TaxID=1158294 RepID=UPI0004A6A888|nr:prealbumin-like fold domain-containing protein [Prevotella sp. 10(H)]